MSLHNSPAPGWRSASRLPSVFSLLSPSLCPAAPYSTVKLCTSRPIQKGKKQLAIANCYFRKKSYIDVSIMTINC